MYLRQLRKLRLVNLAGNPIAASADYRTYVLSHIKDLTYLDYRRVNAADVAAAIEQHQVSPLSHAGVRVANDNWMLFFGWRSHLMEQKAGKQVKSMLLETDAICLAWCFALAEFVVSWLQLDETLCYNM